MSQEHAVTHFVPGDLIHQAGLHGIDLAKVLELIQKYGPLAIQILTDILAHLAKK